MRMRDSGSQNRGFQVAGLHFGFISMLLIKSYKWVNLPGERLETEKQ